jgi:hypothetical protein
MSKWHSDRAITGSDVMYYSAKVVGSMVKVPEIMQEIDQYREEITIY